MVFNIPRSIVECLCVMGFMIAAHGAEPAHDDAASISVIDAAERAQPRTWSAGAIVAAAARLPESLRLKGPQWQERAVACAALQLPGSFEHVAEADRLAIIAEVRMSAAATAAATVAAMVWTQVSDLLAAQHDAPLHAQVLAVAQGWDAVFASGEPYRASGVYRAAAAREDADDAQRLAWARLAVQSAGTDESRLAALASVVEAARLNRAPGQAQEMLDVLRPAMRSEAGRRALAAFSATIAEVASFASMRVAHDAQVRLLTELRGQVEHFEHQLAAAESAGQPPAILDRWRAVLAKARGDLAVASASASAMTPSRP